MYDMTDPVVKEIIQARVTLLFNQPFFGNLATRLELVDGTKFIPTAATDGRKLYYNREFVKKLPRSQLLFLLGHEVLHAVMEHIGRRGNRDPQLWNMATDYIVNYTLKTNNIGEMIPGGLFDERYTDEMTAEEVYNLLKENSVEIQMPLDTHLELEGSGDDDGDDDGDGQRSGKVTVMGDGDGPPTLTEKDLEEIRREMKAAVISAAQSAGAGKVPAGIARMIDQLVHPKMDWRELLETHIKSAFKDDYTFQRISRKTWGLMNGGRGFILPGQDEAEKVDVVCAIDTSGSMSETMLRDFLSEVKGIMETFADFKLTLLTFDTAVYNPIVYTPENLADIVKYPMDGGGGTMFEVVWEYLKENDIEPAKIVVMTDGYPNSTWGDENYADTLFVIHGSHNIVPPFGTYAYYDDHR